VLTTSDDAAYAGEASRPGEDPVDAYYWGHLTQHERKQFSHLRVLIIVPAPRDWYWRQVERGRLVAWKGCHAALLGVGSLPGRTRVSVYDRGLMEEAMDLVGSERHFKGQLVSDNVANKMAHVWVGATVMKTDFGDKTPYYI